MNRKIIIFISSFLTVFTILTVGVSAKEFSEADALKAFGIVKNEAEINEIVTRGAFADIAVNMLGNYVNKESDDKVVFYDVPKSNESFDAINILYNLKIVSGVGDNMFMPDREISVDEILVILKRVMNFSYSASRITNEFTNNIELTNGVDIEDGTKIDYARLYKILYNAMESEPKNIIYSSADAYNNRNKQKSTYMNDRFDIYKIKGSITDNGFTTLFGASNVHRGNIMIDDVQLKLKEEQNIDVGSSVVAYYLYDRHDDEKTLLYYYSDKNEKSVYIPADEIDRYEDNTYSVKNENGKIKKYNLAQDFKIVYNGKAYVGDASVSKEDFDKMMGPEMGSVTLYSSSNSGKYDVVTVKNYKTIVVGGIDTDNETLSDVMNSNFSESFKDIGDVTIKYTSGIITEFERIARRDVVSYAMSADREYCDIIISRQSEDGMLESFDGEKCKINDKEYELSKGFSRYIANNIKLGQVIAYIDASGKIAYIENVYDNLFGYYIDSYMSETEEDMTIKLYTQSNQLISYKLADNVKYNGTSYKNNKKKIYESLKNRCELLENGKRSIHGVGIVSYKVNANDEITEIDTSYNEAAGEASEVGESEDSLHIINGMENQSKNIYYSRYARVINMQVGLKSDTPIFIVPANTDDYESEILVCDPLDSRFQGWDESLNNVTAYSIEKNNMVADVILIYEEYVNGYVYGARTGRMLPQIVTKITTAIDDDNNVVKKIQVSDGLKYNEYYTMSEQEIKNISLSGNDAAVGVGDIIRFGVNKNNKIQTENLEIMYDADKKNVTDDNVEIGKLYAYTTGTVRNQYPDDKNKSILLLDGTIEKVDSNFMQLKTVKDTLVVDIINTPIILCENGRVVNGTYKDLHGDKDGLEGSKAVVYTNAMRTKFVVIYK